MPKIPAQGRWRQRDRDKPRPHEALSQTSVFFPCLTCCASCLPACQVIPQLIARIDTPRPLVGRLIHQLLTDIGRYHPQVRANPEPLSTGLVANFAKAAQETVWD